METKRTLSGYCGKAGNRYTAAVEDGAKTVSVKFTGLEPLDVAVFGLHLQPRPLPAGMAHDKVKVAGVEPGEVIS